MQGLLEKAIVHDKNTVNATAQRLTKEAMSLPDRESLEIWVQ